MNDQVEQERAHERQLVLFMEQICSDLCRFQHVAEDKLTPESIGINREVYLGSAGCFADIRVKLPNNSTYFFEVKLGYPEDKLVAHLACKYGKKNKHTTNASRLVVLTRTTDYANWKDLEKKLQAAICPGLELEIWDELHLLRQMHKYLGVKIGSIERDDLLLVQEAVNRSKISYAFGKEFNDEPLANALLWHFGFWTLRRMHTELGLQPDEILEPSVCRNVVIVMADLCSFSSYVRDTRDDELVRHCLTSFYSLARHAVHNAGGMLYQFVGDNVVALFGLRDNELDNPRYAYECARALLDIANSVSHQWQRELDRVQNARGAHVGIAVGDLLVLPYLPFSKNHIGFVGDALNLTARLMDEANSEEIAVSNRFFQRLDPELQKLFKEMPPLEAKNVGLIQCWKASLAE